jgi:hypothetical protein
VADSVTETTSTIQALLLKLARVGLRYLRQHAEAAQKEGARDLRRLAIGIACCVVGGIFAVHAIIFLHATAIVLLSTIPGARMEFILAGVVAADLSIALFGVLIGASMLRKPLLRQTRATLKEVQTFLVEV